MSNDIVDRVELAFFLVFATAVFASLLGICYLCKNSSKILKAENYQDSFQQQLQALADQPPQVTILDDRRRG